MLRQRLARAQQGDERAALALAEALKYITQSGALAGGDQEREELLEVLQELMEWELPEQLAPQLATKLAMLRWKLLAMLLAQDHVVDEEMQGELWHVAVLAMRQDRHRAYEVQLAIARALVHATLPDLDQAYVMEMVDVLKQMYATLQGSEIRAVLADAIALHLHDECHVDVVVPAGLLRVMLRITLDAVQRSALADGLRIENESVVDLRSCILIFRKIAAHVCPKILEDDAALRPCASIDELCQVVVHLTLSRRLAVVEEAARLLQMLVENEATHAALLHVPDLRGAITKTRIFATTPAGRPKIRDPALQALILALTAQLAPEIDAIEKEQGISLVGLPVVVQNTTSASDLDLDLPSDPTDTIIAQATEWKGQGNAFYRRGNFPTALQFYDAAIASIQAAQQREERALSSLPLDQIRCLCSVGASVLVCDDDTHGAAATRPAMVSDVDGDEIEVMFEDADDDEQVVPLRRIRMRPNTHLLQSLQALTVDCAMNSAKAHALLGQHDRVIEACSLALQHDPQSVDALYRRGVAYIADGNLAPAQHDLYTAYGRCQKWKPVDGTAEASRKAALVAQIQAAYKRLQTRHENKKRTNKKVIKQVLQYMSTIPALQDA